MSRGAFLVWAVVLAGCRPAPDAVVVQPAVQALHERAFIADLHMDPLLHNRDLVRESDDGETDVPRLRAAGVALAGFGIVSEPVPIAGELGIRAWFWWKGFPVAARTSPLARATAGLDAVDRLLAADSGVRLVRNRSDLEAARRAGQLAVVLELEGAQAFADDVTAVRRFFARGLRVVGLTHLKHNELGGSGSPSVPIVDWYLGSDPGLSARGRAVLGEMQGLGYVVDLAHASPRTFDDVLAAWPGPVMVSHTAMAALKAGTRNVTDDQLRAVAARGGVAGIMIGTNFLGGKHLSALADHLVHAIAVAGPEHVSLGLDLDGLAPLPPEFHDVRDLPKLTQLLHDRGLAPAVIEAVLGESARAFFARALPAESD